MVAHRLIASMKPLAHTQTLAAHGSMLGLRLSRRGCHLSPVIDDAALGFAGSPRKLASCGT